MKRFWYLFLYPWLVTLLACILISFDLRYNNIPYVIFLSIIGGLFNVVVLSVLVIKKRLIADIDLTNVNKNEQEEFFLSYSYDLRKILVPYLFILFLAVFWYINFSKITNNYLIGFITWLTVVFSFGVIDLIKTKLQLSSHGISLYSLFGSINASWEDLIGIMQIVRGDDVLIFQKLSYSNNLIEVMYGDYIPISLFDKEWKSNALGKSIQLLAPHLIFIENKN